MVTIRSLFEFICVKAGQNGGYLRTIHDTIITAFFAPHTAHGGASKHDDPLSPSPPLRRIPPAGQYREVIRQATAKTCTDGGRLPGADRRWSRRARQGGVSANP
jgi:hypothetical protein